MGAYGQRDLKNKIKEKKIPGNTNNIFLSLVP